MTASAAAAAEAARRIRRARRIVGLTGAGVSTESGIPDFRGPQGVWTRFDPDAFSFQNFVAHAETRVAFWRWAAELGALLSTAAPNAAHLALAELERRGTMDTLITQNIDRLHHRAGSRAVIELHGNADESECLSCRVVAPISEVAARVQAGESDPRCRRCGGVLKPRTVLFGETLPEADLAAAFAAVRRADLLLVVGSSLLVQPVAGLVPTARLGGAGIVIINLEPTPYDDLADAVIHQPAALTLPRLLD